MSENTRNISVELPEHLLEKLGNAPADKIRELLEKHIKEKISEPRECSVKNSARG